MLGGLAERHGTWLACGTGSKHVLKRDLESVLGVSARVESEGTGCWTRLSHVPSRRMGLCSQPSPDLAILNAVGCVRTL